MSNWEEENGQWKGDAVGYPGIHAWIKRRLIKPLLCQKCNKEKKLDLANISGEYRRDLSDWQYICRKCHMAGDGRFENLKPESALKRGIDGVHNEKPCVICGNPTISKKYYSEACFKEGRRRWWVIYNKKREKYRKDYYKGLKNE